MINNILVATDASAASNRALKMAVQFAGQNNAELLIIHVIRDMQIPFEIKEIPELEFNKFEAFNDAREEIMRKIAESVLRAADTSPEKLDSYLIICTKLRNLDNGQEDHKLFIVGKPSDL